MKIEDWDGWMDDTNVKEQTVRRKKKQKNMNEREKER